MRASALRYVFTPFVGRRLPAALPNLLRIGLATGIKIARRRGGLLDLGLLLGGFLRCLRHCAWYCRTPAAIFARWLADKGLRGIVGFTILVVILIAFGYL